ncbi:RNA 2',3'-cyclic phosphodiesterase [Metapseudomonas otitidis]|uniref:RNA 2',3'-cyclic phosphodiesterase n=1 Tax=Metapseudomonas otitidis TaxID=319939 RepID=UPI0013F67E88|nr:RNA 2',3'-cyclic phosphodiesterase [Pseudomonas otitidis]
MPTPSLRLFFALPLPGPIALAMANWRDTLDCGGQPVAVTNLHLTLAFLGSQPSERLDDLFALADGIRADAFPLHLDRLDLWQPGLLHLAPSQPPAALRDLAATLVERLDAAGFPQERRAYRPHVTLARRARRLPEGAPQTFDWVADRFTLFSSENQEDRLHYRAVHSWPLRADDSNARFTQ